MKFLRSLFKAKDLTVTRREVARWGMRGKFWGSDEGTWFAEYE